MSSKHRKTPPAADDWTNDPVVAEVRRVRAAICREAEGDMAKYFALVRKLAAQVRPEILDSPSEIRTSSERCRKRDPKAVRPRRAA